MAQRNEKCPKCGKYEKCWCIDLQHPKKYHGGKYSSVKGKDNHKVCSGKKYSSDSRKERETDDRKQHFPDPKTGYVRSENHRSYHRRNPESIKNVKSDQASAVIKSKQRSHSFGNPKFSSSTSSHSSHGGPYFPRDDVHSREDSKEEQVRTVRKLVQSSERPSSHSSRDPNYSSSTSSHSSAGRLYSPRDVHSSKDSIKGYVRSETHRGSQRRYTESVEAVKEEQVRTVMKPVQSSERASSHSSRDPKCSSSRASHSSTGRSYSFRDDACSRTDSLSSDFSSTLYASGMDLQLSGTLSHKKVMDADIVRMEEFVRSMIAQKIINYSRNPRSEILRFFRDEVQLRKGEIETAAKHFNKLQQSVVEFLECKTPWKWEAFRAGSHYDRTKLWKGFERSFFPNLSSAAKAVFFSCEYFIDIQVSRPNEMDCILIPNLAVEPVYDGCVTGFCRAKVMTLSQDIKHICDGHFINKSKYRQFIFNVMDTYVKKNSSGDTRCKTNLTHASSPSYGVIYDGVSTDHGSLHIDVDFVPVLHVPSWPPLAIARDLRTLPKKISPNVDVERILKKGVNLATTLCPGSPADQDLQWKVSCSYAEKKLTFYGENTCWKPVLRTMKRVVEIAKGIEGLTITGKSLEIQNAAQYARDHYLRQTGFHLSFSTYFIRSLMWYLLYDLTAGDHVWKEESQENRLKFSLKKLRKMITGELVVPHFFIPGIRDIMTIRSKDREFMYILVRATEIIFSRRGEQ